MRIGTVERLRHLRNCLGELASWIQWIVPSLGYEVIDLHRVVFVGVDEGQVNRNRVRWTTPLDEFIPDNKKVTEPIHTFVFVGGMQIREWLNELIVRVALSYE